MSYLTRLLVTYLRSANALTRQVGQHDTPPASFGESGKTALFHDFFGRRAAKAVKRSAIFSLLAIVIGLAPLSVSAHGEVHRQIEAVSAEIDQTPTAAFYLKRGELYRLDGDYDAALADYDRAAKLDPTLDVISLSRGRTLYEAGRFKAARTSLDRFIKKHPDHAGSRMIRARTLVALEKHAAAVSDFDRYAALTPEPTPECFLEKAEALVALGKREAAIKSLDEGINRLGNLVIFQTTAVELERQLKRFDAALARVDRVLPNLERKEGWQTRRGEILEAAGHHEEALNAYREALASIEQLPSGLRNATPTQELEVRLRRLLNPLP